MDATKGKEPHGTHPERGFLSWGRRIERFLVQAVILAVILLVTVQTLGSGSNAAAFLGYGSWLVEPSPVGPVSPDLAEREDLPVAAQADREGSGREGRIALLLLGRSDGQRVTLFRNGEPLAQFDQPVVRVRLRDRDRIEVENRGTRVVEIRVTAVTPGLQWPREGEVFRPAPGRTPLGVVRIE